MSTGGGEKKTQEKKALDAEERKVEGPLIKDYDKGPWGNPGKTLREEKSRTAVVEEKRGASSSRKECFLRQEKVERSNEKRGIC